VKAEPNPTTPTKPALGGTAAATPTTAQKVLPVKKEDGKSQMEALLSEMKIDIERLRNAAADKSKSEGGLNMDAIKIIFHRFGIDSSGGRTDYNEKLSELLTSLQL
jgi:hypothetical protein